MKKNILIKYRNLIIGILAFLSMLALFGITFGLVQYGHENLASAIFITAFCIPVFYATRRDIIRAEVNPGPVGLQTTYSWAKEPLRYTLCMIPLILFCLILLCTACYFWWQVFS